MGRWIWVSQRGNASVFLTVVGTITVLSTLIGTTMMTQNEKRRGLLQSQNAIEGFYTNEIGAWHSKQRNPADPATNSSRAGRKTLNLNPAPATKGNLPTLSPNFIQTYTDGTPVDVWTTQQFDEYSTTIRRFSASNVDFIPETTVGGQKNWCGTMQFPGSKVGRRSCLSEQAAGPPTVWGSSCDTTVTTPGGMINFEQLPDGTSPSSKPAWSGDSMDLDDQYYASHGVRFCRESSFLSCAGPAKFVKSGGTKTAWTCTSCGSGTPSYDTALATQNLGSFGFADDTDPTTGNPILIKYSEATQAVSGGVVDIDPGESVSIFAYDGFGNQVATTQVNASTPGIGDGMIATWMISTASPTIKFVRLVPSGGDIGYNTFAPRGACANEPTFCLPVAHNSLCPDGYAAYALTDPGNSYATDKIDTLAHCCRVPSDFFESPRQHTFVSADKYYNTSLVQQSSGNTSNTCPNNYVLTGGTSAQGEGYYQCDADNAADKTTCYMRCTKINTVRYKQGSRQQANCYKDANANPASGCAGTVYNRTVLPVMLRWGMGLKSFSLVAGTLNTFNLDHHLSSAAPRPSTNPDNSPSMITERTCKFSNCFYGKQALYTGTVAGDTANGTVPLFPTCTATITVNGTTTETFANFSCPGGY